MLTSYSNSDVTTVKHLVQDCSGGYNYSICIMWCPHWIPTLSYHRFAWSRCSTSMGMSCHPGRWKDHSTTASLLGSRVVASFSHRETPSLKQSEMALPGGGFTSVVYFLIFFYITGFRSSLCAKSFKTLFRWWLQRTNGFEETSPCRSLAIMDETIRPFIYRSCRQKRKKKAQWLPSGNQTSLWKPHPFSSMIFWFKAPLMGVSLNELCLVSLICSVNQHVSHPPNIKHTK